MTCACRLGTLYVLRQTAKQKNSPGKRLPPPGRLVLTHVHHPRPNAFSRVALYCHTIIIIMLYNYYDCIYNNYTA
jgi:hypothetical protein